MPPTDPEPTHQDLYDLVLRRLRELGASSLMRDIDRIVRRGILTTTEEATSRNAAAVRPLNPQEALSVSLEFLLSASLPPLMVRNAQEILQCDEIVWSPDEGGVDEDSVDIAIPEIADLAPLQHALADVAKTMRAIGLRMPEVA